MDAQEVIRELSEEITRLQNELEQTTQEKVQAAEYGLAVLEEKQQLQHQFEDLEANLDTAKHELEAMKDVSRATCISNYFGSVLRQLSFSFRQKEGRCINLYNVRDDACLI